MNPISYLSISLNIISIAAIITIITIITITVGKLDKKGSRELILMIFLILIASVSSFIESLFIEYDVKLLWRNLSQIGYFLIPSASFNFIIVYTNSQNKITKILRILFFIYAVSCVLLIFTNDFHHIMRISISQDQTAKLVINQSIFGMIAVSFNTIISLSGLVRLWIFLMHSSKAGKNQVLFIFIGFFLPILLTYTRSTLSGLIGLPIPTSTSFLLGIIFILIGMFRYNFLSISPLARDWVIDEISLGMVFMDRDGKIVDQNEYSKSLFWNIEEIILRNNSWKSAIEKLEEISLEIEVENSYYSVKVHNLTKKNRSLGTVSLITDITNERKNSIELTHKAERDSMTKIYNRESFVTKVKSYLATSSSSQCCLILIDIDKFKSVNDTYGHSTGDRVIKEIVTIINKSTRDSDLVGRLGGDEFIIFIPETDILSVENLTNRIEKKLSSNKFDSEKSSFYVTLSMGAKISLRNEMNFNELYEAADKALYRAKENGRAQTVFV